MGSQPPSEALLRFICRTGATFTRYSEDFASLAPPSLSSRRPHTVTGVTLTLSLDPVMEFTWPYSSLLECHLLLPWIRLFTVHKRFLQTFSGPNRRYLRTCFDSDELPWNMRRHLFPSPSSWITETFTIHCELAPGTIDLTFFSVLHNSRQHNDITTFLSYLKVLLKLEHTTRPPMNVFIPEEHNSRSSCSLEAIFSQRQISSTATTDNPHAPNATASDVALHSLLLLARHVFFHDLCTIFGLTIANPRKPYSLSVVILFGLALIVLSYRFKTMITLLRQFSETIHDRPLLPECIILCLNRDHVGTTSKSSLLVTGLQDSSNSLYVANGRGLDIELSLLLRLSSPIRSIVILIGALLCLILFSVWWAFGLFRSLGGLVFKTGFILLVQCVGACRCCEDDKACLLLMAIHSFITKIMVLCIMSTVIPFGVASLVLLLRSKARITSMGLSLEVVYHRYLRPVCITLC